MPSMTADRVLREIRQSVEAIRNDRPQQFPEAASPGDYARQGDLYITLLASVPDGWVETPPPPQLVPGTSQGSRHCLDSLDGVRAFRAPAPTPLQGPVLELAVERTITHPEHGHWVLPPGRYAITYQRDLADEERRVVD